jgi:hypothetical protein
VCISLHYRLDSSSSPQTWHRTRSRSSRFVHPRVKHRSRVIFMLPHRIYTSPYHLISPRSASPLDLPWLASPRLASTLTRLGSLCIALPRITLTHLGSPRLASPHLDSPWLASPRLASPRLTLTRLGSLCIALPRITLTHLGSPRLASPRLTLTRLGSLCIDSPRLASP